MSDQAVRVPIDDISVRRISVVQHQKAGKKRFPVLMLKLALVDGTKRYVPFGWPTKDGVKTAKDAVREA